MKKRTHKHRFDVYLWVVWFKLLTQGALTRLLLDLSGASHLDWLQLWYKINQAHQLKLNTSPHVHLQLHYSRASCAIVCSEKTINVCHTPTLLQDIRSDSSTVCSQPLPPWMQCFQLAHDSLNFRLILRRALIEVAGWLVCGDVGDNVLAWRHSLARRCLTPGVRSEHGSEGTGICTIIIDKQML